MTQQVPVVHISVSKAEVVNHVGLLGSDQFVCYHLDLRYQRYSWTLTKVGLLESLRHHKEKYSIGMISLVVLCSGSARCWRCTSP